MLGLSVLLTALLLVSALAEVHFKEEFGDSKWEDRWVQSEHSGKEFGKFTWTAGKFYGDADINKGKPLMADSCRFVNSRLSRAPLCSVTADHWSGVKSVSYRSCQ